MMLLSVCCFACSMVAYACSGVLAAYRLIKHVDDYLVPGSVLLWVGIAAQTTSIGIISSLNHGTSLGGGNVLMLSGWVIAVVFAFVDMRRRERNYVAFAVPVVLAFLLAAWALGALGFNGQGDGMYRDWPLLAIHVSTFFVASALFAISGIASMMLLRQEHLLKTRKISMVLDNQLSSLDTLKRVARRGVVTGLPILSVGLLLGLMREVGLGYGIWYSSVRIEATVDLWLLYAVYLVLVYVVRVPSRHTAVISVLGLLLTIVVAVLSATLPMLG